MTNKKGITNQEIREKKKFLIRKTLTQYGVNVLKICSRNKLGVTGMPFLLHHLVDMGYLEKKETVMEYGDRKGDHIEETARYVITSEGRKLYEKWLKD